MSFHLNDIGTINNNKAHGKVVNFITYSHFLYGSQFAFLFHFSLFLRKRGCFNSIQMFQYILYFHRALFNVHPKIESVSLSYPTIFLIFCFFFFYFCQSLSAATHLNWIFVFFYIKTKKERISFFLECTFPANFRCMISSLLKFCGLFFFLLSFDSVINIYWLPKWSALVAKAEFDSFFFWAAFLLSFMIKQNRILVFNVHSLQSFFWIVFFLSFLTAFPLFFFSFFCSLFRNFFLQ